MNPFSLPDFLQFLDERTERDFSEKRISKHLEQFHLDEDPFLPFIYFCEDSYGRNLIRKTEKFELLVLTWLPGQKMPFHDLNGQRSWAIALSGSLTFTSFQSRTETKLTPGTVWYGDDTKGANSIANPHSKPAISLHLNAAPIPRCQCFNEATGKFEMRELEYFTCLGAEFLEGLLDSPST